MKVLKVTALSMLMVMFFSTANFAQKSVNTSAVSTETVKVVSFLTSAHCGSCKGTIEGTLNKMSGVKKSLLNLDSKVVAVYYKEGETTPDAIKKSIEAKGYTAKSVAKNTSAKKGCCSGNKKTNCADKKKSNCADKKKSNCSDKKKSECSDKKKKSNCGGH